MRTREQVEAALSEVGLSGRITPVQGGYDVELYGELEIGFGVLLDLSKLLKTDDITFAAWQAGSGCPTCGGGVETELQIRWPGGA